MMARSSRAVMGRCGDAVLVLEVNKSYVDGWSHAVSPAASMGREKPAVPMQSTASAMPCVTSPLK